MTMIVCKSCGKEFELTIEEKEFFEKKNLNQPKRCKLCRQIARENKKKQPTLAELEVR